MRHIPRLLHNDFIQTGQHIKLTDKQWHYVKNVMRCPVGSKVRLFNGEGEWDAIIAEDKKQLIVTLGERLKVAVPNPPITLALCNIKPDRLQEALMGAAALGVQKIILLDSDFVSSRPVRFEKIETWLEQAIIQAERFIVPSVISMPLKDWLASGEEQVIFWADEAAKGASQLPLHRDKREVAALIGPEGGFSQEERSTLEEYEKVQKISLGQGILRAEVATLALITLLNHYLCLI